MTSIDLILEGLYLGDIRSAKREKTLKFRGITHVL